MPMYNLLEYSDIYSKTSGSSWQLYRDEPVLNNNNVEVLQIRAKSQTAMVSCSRFIWITNSSDLVG